MKIGNFRYNEKEGSYIGDIQALSFQRSQVEFRPVANKASDREPDFRIVADTPCGTVEFGAAWMKATGRGAEYLSVSLDDPMLQGPVNAALFINDDGETAELVWNRQKRSARALVVRDAA